MRQIQYFLFLFYFGPCYTFVPLDNVIDLCDSTIFHFSTCKEPPCWKCPMMLCCVFLDLYPGLLLGVFALAVMFLLLP